MGTLHLLLGAGSETLMNALSHSILAVLDDPDLRERVTSGQISWDEVFEETLHVIVRPPLVWRGRGGLAVRFGAYDQHSIGVVTDVLDIPKREDSVTVRVGPVMRFVLSRRVELRGSFVFTMASPDNIGLIGGDFAELGVRYRWASE